MTARYTLMSVKRYDSQIHIDVSAMTAKYILMSAKCYDSQAHVSVSRVITHYTPTRNTVTCVILADKRTHSDTEFLLKHISPKWSRIAE